MKTITVSAEVKKHLDLWQRNEREYVGFKDINGNVYLLIHGTSHGHVSYAGWQGKASDLIKAWWDAGVMPKHDITIISCYCGVQDTVYIDGYTIAPVGRYMDVISVPTIDNGNDTFNILIIDFSPVEV